MQARFTLLLTVSALVVLMKNDCLSAIISNTGATLVNPTSHINSELRYTFGPLFGPTDVAGEEDFSNSLLEHRQFDWSPAGFADGTVTFDFGALVSVALDGPGQSTASGFARGFIGHSGSIEYDPPHDPTLTVSWPLGFIKLTGNIPVTDNMQYSIAVERFGTGQNEERHFVPGVPGTVQFGETIVGTGVFEKLLPVPDLGGVTFHAGTYEYHLQVFTSLRLRHNVYGSSQQSSDTPPGAWIKAEFLPGLFEFTPESVPVPEPSSLGLLVIGSICAVAGRPAGRKRLYRLSNPQ